MAKGLITIVINTKEAVEIISGSVPKSLTKKVVDGLRVANVRPLGEKASILGRAKRTRAPKTIVIPDNILD